MTCQTCNGLASTTSDMICACNQITPHTFLIASTAEEATEVAEAAGQVAQLASKLAQSIIKGVRFGQDDVYQGVTNWQRVEQELRELIALAQTLGLDTTPCPNKMARVHHWLQYATQRGVVTSANLPHHENWMEHQA